MQGLQFSEASFKGLTTLDEPGWREALQFSDRTQLTLPLGLRCREHMPAWVRNRIDRNLRDNATCWQSTKTTYFEAAAAFQSAGLDYLVLKGFGQCPDFVSAPRYRAQYDIDLLFPEDQVYRARDVALELGYEPLKTFNRFPIDHLPTMIRKTGWEWRGEHFDIAIPLSLELHFRLWDSPTEHIEVRGLGGFCERRRAREIEGLSFQSLHPADAVAYSSLHLLRHLLRGDLRPSHVYELAWLLEHKAHETSFWQMWSRLHDPSMRSLESICFGLARSWFGCQLAPLITEEVEQLPKPMLRWLALYSHSPIETIFYPNKHELWLHLELVASLSDKAAVLRRRLFPISLPGRVDAIHLPESEVTWRIRFRRAWRYTSYVFSRVFHHARTLPGVVSTGLWWWRPEVGLGTQYWRFFAAAGLFDFGLFIFFLLYNLYLLQLGFTETFLGFVSSSMLGGSIAGSIPAAIVIERLGVQPALLLCFVMVTCVAGLRAWVTQAPALLVLAFLAGLASSIWAVAISPAVAQLTNERNRPLGFSLVFSSGIAIGALGGLVGSRLPGWLGHAGYRGALWVGCGIVLLGLGPLLGLKLGRRERDATVFHQPSPGLTRFLIAGAVWNLGTGALNPFFSAFLTRLKMPVEQIGLVFSLSQLVQVAAILLAPLALRRFGLVRGISGMQFATGAALAVLGATAGPVAASGAYAAYMVFQYMSEPGMYTLLMEVAPANQRSSASALNFLVASAAQAIAAAAAGAAVERFGYSPVTMVAAILCVIAGVLFRVLLAPSSRPYAAGTT